jgi:hypothetical protein
VWSGGGADEEVEKGERRLMVVTAIGGAANGRCSMRGWGWVGVFEESVLSGGVLRRRMKRRQAHLSLFFLPSLLPPLSSSLLLLSRHKNRSLSLSSPSPLTHTN